MRHLDTNFATKDTQMRLDLALEAKEWGEQWGPVPGVKSSVITKSGVQITTVEVENEVGSRFIGKLPGHYVTFEAPSLRQHNPEFHGTVANLLAEYLATFLMQVGIQKAAKVLIVGLGNWNVTPDALGPLVVENVMITRHLYEMMPDQVEKGYRNVSAVAPGVLGTTGIESSDIVQGIVDRTKPDVVIAIDALASRSLDRVNTTIQIANTGIHPGSGIGNKRKGLTKDVLGVPVIAIGVPTVVYASTIVNNSIDLLKKHLEKHTSYSTFGLLDQMKEQERLQLMRECLGPLGHDLLVTPKEVDQFIEDIANIIAIGLNAGLHDAVNPTNVEAYTH